MPKKHIPTRYVKTDPSFASDIPRTPLPPKEYRMRCDPTNSILLTQVSSAQWLLLVVSNGEKIASRGTHAVLLATTESNGDATRKKFVKINTACLLKCTEIAVDAQTTDGGFSCRTLSGLIPSFSHQAIPSWMSAENIRNHKSSHTPASRRRTKRSRRDGFTPTYFVVLSYRQLSPFDT